MMNNAPGPNEIKGTIGEIHGFRIHPVNRALQVEQFKSPACAIYGVFCQIDTGIASAMRGQELCVTPIADANFKQIELPQFVEGNNVVKRSCSSWHVPVGIGEEAIVDLPKELSGK